MVIQITVNADFERFIFRTRVTKQTINVINNPNIIFSLKKLITHFCPRSEELNSQFTQIPFFSGILESLSIYLVCRFVYIFRHIEFLKWTKNLDLLLRKLQNIYFEWTPLNGDKNILHKNRHRQTTWNITYIERKNFHLGRYIG